MYTWRERTPNNAGRSVWSESQVYEKRWQLSTPVEQMTQELDSHQKDGLHDYTDNSPLVQFWEQNYQYTLLASEFRTLTLYRYGPEWRLLQRRRRDRRWLLHWRLLREWTCCWGEVKSGELEMRPFGVVQFHNTVSRTCSPGSKFIIPSFCISTCRIRLRCCLSVVFRSDSDRTL